MLLVCIKKSINMVNLTFYSLLLIVCCVVSMIEAHSIPLAESSSSMISEREAKNLLLFPFQPIQSHHSYGPQSRFGFGSRQTNSPISPAIAQNGLGPFFGIFPNLLTQPCPDCPACTTEAPPTTTTQAPAVCPAPPPPPAPPAAQTITNCSLPNESMYVAAFNGTIKLNAPKTANGDSVNCMYKIVAAYPNTKVSLTCTSKSDKINLVIMSSYKDSTGATFPASGSLGAQGGVYTSISNYFDIVLNNLPDATQNVQAECTFQSIA